MVKCQSALFCYRTYCYLGHIIFCIAWRVYLSQWYCKWVSAAVRCSCSAGTTQGTAALFLFYSLSTFSDFSFMFVFLTVLFLFLGASFVCVNNLKKAADLVLWSPYKTSVCTYLWPYLTTLNNSCKMLYINILIWNSQSHEKIFLGNT